MSSVADGEDGDGDFKDVFSVRLELADFEDALDLSEESGFEEDRYGNSR